MYELGIYRFGMVSRTNWHCL